MCSQTEPDSPLGSFVKQSWEENTNIQQQTGQTSPLFCNERLMVENGVYGSKTNRKKKLEIQAEDQ